MERSRDRDLELVKQHVEQLGEHFDSVQIFVTRHEAGELDGTININTGAGNWFARYGHIRNWINTEEAISADRAQRDARR